MNVKKLSRYDRPGPAGPGFTSISFDSKIKRRETHTGTFLEMRVHVTKVITMHSKWDAGQTADINIFRVKTKGETREIGFLSETKEILKGMLIGL